MRRSSPSGRVSKAPPLYATTYATRKLLSKQALAEFLGIGVKGVQRLDKSGRGPKSIRIGQLVKWRPEDVEEWLVAVAVQGAVRVSEPVAKGGR